MVSMQHGRMVTKEGFCPLCDGRLKMDQHICCGELVDDKKTVKGEVQFKMTGHDIVSTLPAFFIIGKNYAHC
jgi:hypothetical protein